VRKNPTTKPVSFLEHTSRIIIVDDFQFLFVLFAYFSPNDFMNNNSVPTIFILLDVYNISAGVLYYICKYIILLLFII